MYLLLFGRQVMSILLEMCTLIVRISRKCSPILLVSIVDFKCKSKLTCSRFLFFIHTYMHIDFQIHLQLEIDNNHCLESGIWIKLFYLMLLWKYFCFCIKLFPIFFSYAFICSFVCGTSLRSWSQCHFWGQCIWQNLWLKWLPLSLSPSLFWRLWIWMISPCWHQEGSCISAFYLRPFLSILKTWYGIFSRVQQWPLNLKVLGKV